MPTPGTTAPATTAGALAMADAEVISATVAVQLAAPGVAGSHAILPSVCDRRTGASVNKPLNRSGRHAVVEIANHEGMPSQAEAFGTSSAVPGTWQSGSEVALDPHPLALAGADIVAGIGLTEDFASSALESLLLDADVYHRARHALMNVEVDARRLWRATRSERSDRVVTSSGRSTPDSTSAKLHGSVCNTSVARTVCCAIPSSSRVSVSSGAVITMSQSRCPLNRGRNSPPSRRRRTACYADGDPLPPSESADSGHRRAR